MGRVGYSGELAVGRIDCKSRKAYMVIVNIAGHFTLDVLM